MTSRRPMLALVACAIAAVVSAGRDVSAAGPLVEVTTCGQHVPPYATGYLSGDLTCATQVGVYLGMRSKLDLRGYTLDGGSEVTVACEPFNCPSPTCVKGSKCEVFGGTLTNAGYAAIAGGKVDAHDLTISNAAAYAVLAFSEIKVRNAQMSNNRIGLQANRKIVIEGSTITSTPIQAEKVQLRSSSVTAAEYYGVIGAVIKLQDSHVVGNGTSVVDCGINIGCADIVSRKRPLLDATSTCDRSLKNADIREPLVSYGVCALD